MNIQFGATIVSFSQKRATEIQRQMERTATGKRALHETSADIVIEDSQNFYNPNVRKENAPLFVDLKFPKVTDAPQVKEELLKHGRMGVKQLDPCRPNPVVDDMGIGRHGFEGSGAHYHLKLLDFCNQIFAVDDVLKLSAFQAAVGAAFGKNKQTPDPAFNAIKGAFFQTIGTITGGTATGAALDTEIKGAIRQFYTQLVEQKFVAVEGNATSVIEAATEAKLPETRQQVLTKRTA